MRTSISASGEPFSVTVPETIPVEADEVWADAAWIPESAINASAIAAARASRFATRMIHLEEVSGAGRERPRLDRFVATPARGSPANTCAMRRVGPHLSIPGVPAVRAGR